MNASTQYILNKFKIEYHGCVCKHLPENHVHEVKNCTQCPCEVYHAALPLEIPNFGRDNLPQLFRELGYTKGAEVGVMQGDYSQVLCRDYPELKLYCVDAWQQYPGYYLGDQRTMDQFYNRARRRLKKYDVKLVREFSVEAAKQFADDSLDFLYLDAAHDFVNVINDLNAWIPKVRPGGAISGHDFIKRGMGPTVFGKANKTFHVKEAVEAWTGAFLVDPWFLLGRRIPQRADEIRDKIRSFLWIKD